MANEMDTHLAAILERVEHSVGIIAEGHSHLRDVTDQLTARLDATVADVALLRLQVDALRRDVRKRPGKKGG